MATAHLEKKRSASLRRRHPWIFRGAIARVDGSASPGDTVEVVDAQGQWMARGALSPASQIAVRVWTFEKEEPIDSAFFRRRLEQALEVRRPWIEDGAVDGSSEKAFRWVHGESDGLPGCVIDVYGETAVVQLLSAGADRWRSTLVELLPQIYPLARIFERSDVDIRSKEGLKPRSGTLHGSEPSDLVEIREGSYRFLVDIHNGHKTGFYLDQRRNREKVQAVCEGREVLNSFCYTGGFSVAALAGGASQVVQIDASSNALALASRNLEMAGFAPPEAEDSKVVSLEGNVFSELRRLRAEEARFDIIVLDPPKFVESKRQLERATRGYKDINLLAFQLLRPGGLLFTFSCSGLLSAELFQKIVAGAALDAGRFVRVIETLSASPDHPMALSFPEGSYLKGLICRAD